MVFNFFFLNYGLEDVTLCRGKEKVGRLGPAYVILRPVLPEIYELVTRPSNTRRFVLALDPVAIGVE